MKNKKLIFITCCFFAILFLIALTTPGTNVFNQGKFNNFNIGKGNDLALGEIQYSCSSWKIVGDSPWYSGAPSSGNTTCSPPTSCTDLKRYTCVVVETTTKCITDYGSNQVPCYKNVTYERTSTISSCSSGRYLDGGSCKVCPAGSYCSDGLSKKACNGTNQYQDSTGQDSCKTIPENSTANSDHTSFTCNTGYIKNGNTCVLKPIVNCPTEMYIGETKTCGVNNGTITGQVTSSSDVASVVSVGGSTFSISGKSVGKATFTVNVNGQSVTSNEVEIKEVSVPVSSISISCNSSTIDEGSSTKCTATVLPANATSNVVWSVDNTSFASINPIGSTVNVVARSTGKVTVTAKSSTDPTKYDTFTIQIKQKLTIEGQNIIAIAADVGKVTGSYGAKDDSSNYVNVYWGANGSGAAFANCDNTTSCKITFSHQGNSGSVSETYATVSARDGNILRNYNVKVYSYCAWSLVDSNKGPFSSDEYAKMQGTRDSMKYVQGCDAYEGWNKRSDGWYYVNHYNRCCGSGSDNPPSTPTESKACYVKRGSDTPNTYCYGTQTSCQGYNEIVSNVTSVNDCTEKSACYQKSDGTYVTGEYSGQSGYKYIGTTCPTSPEVTNACYKNANGEYKWGDYSKDSNYTLVTNITNENNCKNTVDVPSTSSGIATIVYICSIIMAMFGVSLVWLYRKKNNDLEESK